MQMTLRFCITHFTHTLLPQLKQARTLPDFSSFATTTQMCHVIPVSHHNCEALELWWAVEDHSGYYDFNNKTLRRLVGMTIVNTILWMGENVHSRIISSKS